jgi:hypothetical protein
VFTDGAQHMLFGDHATPSSRSSGSNGNDDDDVVARTAAANVHHAGNASAATTTTTSGGVGLFAAHSPYQRATFRYSPLLGAAALGNVLLTPWCGKLLFVLCDLVAAACILGILNATTAKGSSSRNSTLLCCAWLFNPLVVNISTRGNADVLVAALVLATLYALLCKHYKSAAMLYGLSVHLKLYPIVYAPAIMLYLHSRDLGFPSNAAAHAARAQDSSLVARATRRIRAQLQLKRRFNEQAVHHHYNNNDGDDDEDSSAYTRWFHYSPWCRCSSSLLTFPLVSAATFFALLGVFYVW